MHSEKTSRGRLLTTMPQYGARVLWSNILSAASAGMRPIRAVIAGADPNGTSARAAIYVCYDRHSLVADYVVAQVAALAACGWRVIFISHSRRLNRDGAARLAPHVREIVHRRNYGHDFGAFKEGIARLGDLAEIASLVLMNDSCYGPFGSLADLETRAQASGCDLFGITESWAHRYHLQTYFVRISHAAVASPAFAAFWKSLPIRQSREMTIFRGEIRFTQDMLKAGFKVGALCPYTEVAQQVYDLARQRLAQDGLLPHEERYLAQLAGHILAGVPLNPSHFFWDVLIGTYDAPFIKRELLRKNPAGVPGLVGWEQTVRNAAATEAIDAARQHLKIG